MPGREEGAEKREVRFRSCSLRFGIRTLPRVRRPIRGKEQTCCSSLFLCPAVSRCVAQAAVAGRWLSSFPSLQRSQSHAAQRWGWNVQKRTGCMHARSLLPLPLLLTLKISSRRKSNMFKRAFAPHVELHPKVLSYTNDWQYLWRVLLGVLLQWRLSFHHIHSHTLSNHMVTLPFISNPPVLIIVRTEVKVPLESEDITKI